MKKLIKIIKNNLIYKSYNHSFHKFNFLSKYQIIRIEFDNLLVFLFLVILL